MKEIRQPYYSRRPGKLFEDLITTTSHITADCGFCNRVFFEDNEKAGDWEDGELEKLREMAVKEPDKYIAMDHVACGRMNGTEGVIGCPCNWGTQFEITFWDNRKFIMEYLSARIKVVVERALQDEAYADQATGDVAHEAIAVQTVRCPKCMAFVSKLAMPSPDACVHCLRKEAEQKEMVRLAKEAAIEDQKRLLEQQQRLQAEEEATAWETNQKIENERRQRQAESERKRYKSRIEEFIKEGLSEDEAREAVRHEDEDNLPF